MAASFHPELEVFAYCDTIFISYVAIVLKVVSTDLKLESSETCYEVTATSSYLKLKADLFPLQMFFHSLFGCCTLTMSVLVELCTVTCSLSCTVLTE